MLKGNATNVLSVRLSDRDHAALAVFAARERRTMSDAYRIILQDRLATEGCYPVEDKRKPRKPSEQRDGV